MTCKQGDCLIKLYRCRICGDPYIGTAKPSRCPFCGAYEELIVEAGDYNETFEVDLNEKDSANVKKALEIEISNSAFYMCAFERSVNGGEKQLFKALGKVEAEHASIWKKILKLPKITIPKSEECTTEYEANLKESHERELKAIAFYSLAAAEAGNPRVKQIFAALVDVEKDHLEFSKG